jgi:hypothetical protein
VLALAGCASKSGEIAPAYVSPVMYQNYTCQQIAQESQNVAAHAANARTSPLATQALWGSQGGST